MSPMMNPTAAMVQPGIGALGGVNIPFTGDMGGPGGGRSRHDGKPPSKMMRMDDSGMFCNFYAMIPYMCINDESAQAFTIRCFQSNSSNSGDINRL